MWSWKRESVVVEIRRWPIHFSIFKKRRTDLKEEEGRSFKLMNSIDQWFSLTTWFSSLFGEKRSAKFENKKKKSKEKRKRKKKPETKQEMDQ